MIYGRFAAYYDLLYQSQGKDYEREACRLHRLIQRYKRSSGNRLLDVGCGTGEHLRYLRAFYQVQGVDRSPEMLHIARQKLPEVEFHLGDMRSFHLEKTFDVIVCLFGSIGYVETYEGLRQAIENMKRHLSQDGILIIEPWFGPEEIENGHTHLAVVEERERKVVRIGYTHVQGKCSEIRFHFVIADRRGIDAFEENHRLGLFTEEEYRQAIEGAGLRVFCEEGLFNRGVYVGCFPQS